MARTRYASDRGLIARMGATMFLLGLVFTGFIIALYFVFFWYGHRHGGGGSSAGLVVLAAVIGVGAGFGGHHRAGKMPPKPPRGPPGTPPPSPEMPGQLCRIWGLAKKAQTREGD